MALTGLAVLLALAHARAGTFDADGGPQRISGLGFRPDAILVRNDSSGGGVLATAAMPPGNSKHFTLPDPLMASEVTSLDSDGFSLGDAGWVAARGTVRWLALAGTPSTLVAGTYAGDGAPGRFIATPGMTPAMVLLTPSIGPAIHASAAMDPGIAIGLGTDMGVTGLISALTSGGFVVEPLMRANQTGLTYYYVALGALPGRWAFSALVGDGGAQTFDLGFRPVFVSGKSPSFMGMFRVDDGSTSYAAPWGSGSLGTGLLVTPNGFTLDRLNVVEGGGVASTWFAFSAGPETVLTSTPPALSSGPAASFAFDASVPGSTFDCRVDDAGFQTCASPASVSGLALGTHAFEVRAVDPTGASDPSPARYQWMVISDTGAGGGSAGGGSNVGGGSGGDGSRRAYDVGCGCSAPAFAPLFLVLALALRTSALRSAHRRLRRRTRHLL